jgi:hypothetical protein
VPLANALVGTATVGADVLLFLLPFAFGMMLFEERRKAFARRRSERRS